MHLSLLEKSTLVLDGWTVNKWLRLNNPQPEIWRKQRETTSIPSHATPRDATPRWQWQIVTNLHSAECLIINYKVTLPEVLCYKQQNHRTLDKQEMAFYRDWDSGAELAVFNIFFVHRAYRMLQLNNSARCQGYHTGLRRLSGLQNVSSLSLALLSSPSR